MAEEKQNKNGLPPAPGSSPNWGLWILMAVITGILLLAFTSDGNLGSAARNITLDEFRKDYRAGKVVLTDPDKYPIEVVSNDSSSNAVITAYVYKGEPAFTYAPFYMPFTESEELKTLFNRYGITQIVVEEHSDEATKEALFFGSGCKNCPNHLCQ